jgi:hypothetical protein
LHLDGNWIECNSAKYISKMIRQNDFITELVIQSKLKKISYFKNIKISLNNCFFKSLADNRLGETREGAIEVCRMISENCILRKLNISGNLFSDRDADILTGALEVFFIHSVTNFAIFKSK